MQKINPSALPVKSTAADCTKEVPAAKSTAVDYTKESPAVKSTAADLTAGNPKTRAAIVDEVPKEQGCNIESAQTTKRETGRLINIIQ